MKDYPYYLIAAGLLILVSVGKTLDKFIKKEAVGKLGVVSSLVFSLIGGTLAGMLSSVYIETVQIQWVFIAGGAWMGERVLDAIATSIESKIDLIFKKKNHGNDEEKE